MCHCRWLTDAEREAAFSTCPCYVIQSQIVIPKHTRIWEILNGLRRIYLDIHVHMCAHTSNNIYNNIYNSNDWGYLGVVGGEKAKNGNYINTGFMHEIVKINCVCEYMCEPCKVTSNICMWCYMCVCVHVCIQIQLSQHILHWYILTIWDFYEPI